LYSSQTIAQESKIDTLKYCLLTATIGVGGYDPVSYFEGISQLGTAQFTAIHDGVTYRFASEKHKIQFKANPIVYLPQFGGWCSMTLAMGRATSPKYDNFLVSQGKLYLFERTLSVNGRELWLKNPIENQKIASKNYKQFKRTGKIK
ncbi:MAG: hypothetical protein HOP30_09925, partial [Cyclobacteriaceae bacterium]|nr:hypothetical protein [Cyclobacteriaceae bacterium]